MKARLALLTAAVAPSTIFYSLKANPRPEVLRVIAAVGLGADISTEGELDSALAAGFPPDRISCVGPWKPPALLARAFQLGVARICFESLAEAAFLRTHAPSTIELFARALLPDEQLVLAERMATTVSPFGLTPDEIAGLIRSGMRIDGVHLYAGSDIVDPAHSCRSLALFRDSLPEMVCGIQFGPGLGIAYDLEGSDPSWADLVLAATREADGRRLTFELGRYIVAHTAALLTTVQIVKRRGEQTLCILDGGMTVFARTIITDAVHSVIRVGHPISWDSPSRSQIRLCGPSCTPLDTIRARCYFNEVQEGDVLAVLSAGAYGVNLCFGGFMGFPPASFTVATDAPLAV